MYEDPFDFLKADDNLYVKSMDSNWTAVLHPYSLLGNLKKAEWFEPLTLMSVVFSSSI